MEATTAQETFIRIMTSDLPPAELLAADLDMDIDGLRCCVSALADFNGNPAEYITGILTPMAERFRAYIAAAYAIGALPELAPKPTPKPDPYTTNQPTQLEQMLGLPHEVTP